MGKVSSGRDNRSKRKTTGPKTAQREKTRLVVLSVDGLRADLLLRSDDFKLKIPALREMVRAGASAEGVESIFPSTTYPAHTTIVTGVPPRVHGIYSHLDSRDPSAAARPWHWFAKAINVPTLWDAARAAGMKSASIGWPSRIKDMPLRAEERASLLRTISTMRFFPPIRTSRFNVFHPIFLNQPVHTAGTEELLRSPVRVLAKQFASAF